MNICNFHIFSLNIEKDKMFPHAVLKIWEISEKVWDIEFQNQLDQLKIVLINLNLC